MKRLNFKDCTNDNAMDVTIVEYGVSFYSQDDETDTLVEVIVPNEQLNRLIKHLSKAVKQD